MSRLGGEAFPGQWMDFQPGTGHQVVRDQWAGMSLRDYFAAAAMQALLPAFEQSNEERREVAVRVAERAYEIAYAMTCVHDRIESNP